MEMLGCNSQELIRRTLQTNRLTLVPLGEEHLEFEVTLDAQPDVMRYLGTGEPRERLEVEEHHQERIDEARNGLGFWAGFVGADFVGWWLLTLEDDDEGGQAEPGVSAVTGFLTPRIERGVVNCQSVVEMALGIEKRVWSGLSPRPHPLTVF